MLRDDGAGVRREAEGREVAGAEGGVVGAAHLGLLVLLACCGRGGRFEDVQGHELADVVEEGGGDGGGRAVGLGGEVGALQGVFELAYRFAYVVALGVGGEEGEEGCGAITGRLGEGGKGEGAG